MPGMFPGEIFCCRFAGLLLLLRRRRVPLRDFAMRIMPRRNCQHATWSNQRRPMHRVLAGPFLCWREVDGGLPPRQLE